MKKNLVLVVHANMQHDLADQLRGMACISGFTFSEVQGHGARDARDAFLSMRDKVVGYTPHIRVEILLEDEDIPTVLEQLKNAVNHARDQGIYWVMPVEQSGRL